MKTISYTTVLDLSHPLDAAAPRWPGDPPVQIEPAASLDRDGYRLSRVSLGEHTGTHLNAPAHFIDGGATLDAISPERLVLPAARLDFSAACAANPDAVFGLAELAAWEAQHGPFPAGALALLHTGWQSRWPDAQRFFNPDEAGRLHFPGFGLDVARRLLEERGAAGLGSDAHGVEPGLDETFAVNRLALSRGALVLENLCNLDQLPVTGATLLIGALPLRGGSGAPARVLALV